MDFSFRNRRIRSLLKSGRIRFCRGCDDTVREFYQYRWDERAGKEAPLKQNDHAMDDVRYFAYTILRALLRTAYKDTQDSVLAIFRGRYL